MLSHVRPQCGDGIEFWESACLQSTPIIEMQLPKGHNLLFTKGLNYSNVLKLVNQGCEGATNFIPTKGLYSDRCMSLDRIRAPQKIGIGMIWFNNEHKFQI